jgi:hypothetical protein
MRQKGEEDKNERDCSIRPEIRLDRKKTRWRILATDTEEATRRWDCEKLNTDKAALSSRAGVLVGKRSPPPPCIAVQVKTNTTFNPLTPFKSEKSPHVHVAS